MLQAFQNLTSIYLYYAKHSPLSNAGEHVAHHWEFLIPGVSYSPEEVLFGIEEGIEGDEKMGKS